jgi:hypothetical protein
MSAEESCMDPSLPLQEESLAEGSLLPLQDETLHPTRSVHWVTDSQAAHQGEDSRWQVDGSSDSIGMKTLFFYFLANFVDPGTATCFDVSDPDPN